MTQVKKFYYKEKKQKNFNSSVINKEHVKVFVKLFYNQEYKNLNQIIKFELQIKIISKKIYRGRNNQIVN